MANCVIVPESPTSTPDDVAGPTSTPCFWRNRMFMIVDDAPVGATRFTNDTAICRSIVAGTSGMGLRHRTDGGARERDRGRLREHEADDQPRPVGGLQRVDEVADAADLAEDHPQREQQRDEHHDVERLHPSQLDRADELTARARRDRGRELVEEALCRCGARGAWPG